MPVPSARPGYCESIAAALAEVGGHGAFPLAWAADPGALDLGFDHLLDVHRARDDRPDHARAGPWTAACRAYYEHDVTDLGRRAWDAVRSGVEASGLAGVEPPLALFAWPGGDGSGVLALAAFEALDFRRSGAATWHRSFRGEAVVLGPGRRLSPLPFDCLARLLKATRAIGAAWSAGAVRGRLEAAASDWFFEAICRAIPPSGRWRDDPRQAFFPFATWPAPAVVG